MKEIFLSLITTLFAFTVKAQVKSFDYDFDTKVIYKHTYQYDSTSTESRKGILMQLEIGNQASHFQAIGKFKSDSSASSTGGNKFTFYNYGRVNPNYYLIIKKDEKICIYDPLNGIGLTGNNQLAYYEENKENLNWEIHPDTAHIDKFVCQKATTNWGGRKWTAWFTMDIPISDGPYKFCGLPGLILAISDQDKYFTFDIASIQQVKKTPINLEKIRADLAIEKTTKEKFYKDRKELSANMITYAAATGTKLTEENKQAVITEVKTDNNHIERY